MTVQEIVEGMLRAHELGRIAGRRGWATLDDLKLQTLTKPGVADAYRMGRERGEREAAAAHAFAGCPQMPEEGVTEPPRGGD